VTTTYVRPHRGIPALYLDDRRLAPIAAYVGPRYVEPFSQAGIQLYTFSVRGRWWVGPGQYDFAAIDRYLANYVARLPDGYFMPRIDLSSQGWPWWGEAHPDEMNVLLDIASGEVLDPLEPNPEAVHYLGHEVGLESKNLHSFHSLAWREDAGRAVAALVAHCEAQPYADRLWAWQFCDGLFCEWFHWHEYSFAGLSDYAPAAQADFRQWLRRVYQNDPDRLSRAWGRALDFDQVAVPSPQERVQPGRGEFYDPVRDRPTIDYTLCFNEATADSIIAVCEAAKRALPQPKAVCVFYGYQFSDMPRPQLNAHYALRRLLDSPAVDLIASPHAYNNRGHGGYHSPQSIADAIRRAGKIHLDEIDCKTVWTPDSVTWKRHISQPHTVRATIEMMKKDAAYSLASATGCWWMDLTDQGWFDAPEAVTPIRRLKAVEERLQTMDRGSFGQVALVVSQRSMAFQAPKAGLHNATLLMFRNWHLSRIGAPFEQLMLDDLGRSDLPEFKLYIMANTFYLSAEERALLDRAAKRNGATVLWIYAPGYMDDRSASLANMEMLTGFRFGMADVCDELDVTVIEFDHPITHSLPPGTAYGTGVDREAYMRPPKIEYLPETAVRPAFYVDDPEAQVLGVARSTGKTGLAVKDFGDWRSIYSSAPLLPWPLLRDIAREAGVHIYDDRGDMVWANNAFLALYSQSAGSRTVRFPRPVTVEDAYDGGILGTGITSLQLTMSQWETKLLFTI
jgi:hypothetical protein